MSALLQVPAAILAVLLSAAATAQEAPQSPPPAAGAPTAAQPTAAQPTARRRPATDILVVNRDRRPVSYFEISDGTAVAKISQPLRSGGQVRLPLKDFTECAAFIHFVIDEQPQGGNQVDLCGRRRILLRRW